MVAVHYHEGGREGGREEGGEAGRETGARGCTESQQCWCVFITEVTEPGKAGCFVSGEGGGRSSGGGSSLPRGREGGRKGVRPGEKPGRGGVQKANIASGSLLPR